MISSERVTCCLPENSVRKARLEDPNMCQGENIASVLIFFSYLR